MDGFPSEVSESAPQLKVFAPTSQLAAARTRTKPQQPRSSRSEPGSGELGVPSDSDPLEPTSFWAGVIGFLPSWLVSTVLHLVLLILLAVWSMGNAPGKQVVLVELTEAAQSLDTMANEIEHAEIVLEESAEMELAELEPLELEAPEIPQEMMESLDLPDALLPKDHGLELARFGAAGFGAQSSKSSDASSSGGPGASFFGVESDGNQFVFVIDCSGSMRGSRWYRAVKELNEAISDLEPTQEFLVLLYNSGMKVMFDKSLVKAGLVFAHEDNRLRSQRWLRKQRPNGGTYPSQAMYAALMMSPDAIFLLSDGELQDNTADLLQIWNVDREDSYGEQSKIPIHTISLGPKGVGHQMMKSIAGDNNGEFYWAR